MFCWLGGERGGDVGVILQSDEGRNEKRARSLLGEK